MTDNIFDICTFCEYYPASSGDGKPCTICPASGRKIETNADRIRAMSDEELANKCVRYEGQCVIPTKWGVHKHIFYGPKGETCTDREEFVKMWLDWLKQPAEEAQP